MKLTIVGSGDAFGSGGHTNTCFFLETAKAKLLVDCGASALPALKGQGVPLNEIDGVVLSHLHGDHFGGLPFLLLDARFLSKREKPLLIAGPPGTRDRLTAAMEVFFPKSSTSKWGFDWHVEEIVVGVKTDVLGHSLITAEVIHQSGAPSTALRLSDGEKTFAYSGDTEWTDALLPIASRRSRREAHDDHPHESDHAGEYRGRKSRRRAGCRRRPDVGILNAARLTSGRAARSGSTCPSGCRPSTALPNRTDRPAR
jgi:ribonuclease BN (tRNA processing enzyme)